MLFNTEKSRVFFHGYRGVIVLSEIVIGGYYCISSAPGRQTGVAYVNGGFQSWGHRVSVTSTCVNMRCVSKCDVTSQKNHQCSVGTWPTAVGADPGSGPGSRTAAWLTLKKKWTLLNVKNARFLLSCTLRKKNTCNGSWWKLKLAQGARLPGSALSVQCVFLSTCVEARRSYVKHTKCAPHWHWRTK